jgi:NAD(P)-dependent dehydrogenase (short-subunit alcohol dehydrogenase family)
MASNRGNGCGMTGFTGKAALVTGATSGLGRHFAVLLARQGIGRLWIAGRRADALQETAALCREAGCGDVRAEVLDVSDAAAVETAVAGIGAAGRLDILVNNAGIADTAPAIDTPIESFDRIIATNLRGAWLMAQGAARLMRGAGGGDIVTIASILGLRVATNVAPYAISKAGVVQMTKALALEWARFGIRVNALCPGYVRTEINADFFATEAGAAMVKRIPMRRLSDPADLDAPFLLFASGASSTLTGAVLTVDGGHSVNSL